MDDYLANRPAQLEEAKKNGVKIIGYFPGNYVPEELIYASGAIPVCLAHGGSPQPADAALAAVPHIICPFARAQIGERMLKQNPYYNMIDMLVAPITCQHLKKVTELWEYYGDLDLFKLGVPQQHSHDFEVAYYIDRLRALRERLQAFTGNEITDAKLSQAIDLYNKMRALFKELNRIHRDSPSLLSALDFVKLNHASLYADPAVMVKTLETIRGELKGKEAPANNGAPRIMLVGPNVGYGDYRVLEMVAAAGGDIVAEEICEGMRYFWNQAENKGDLLQSLARTYLVDRVPCAFMRFSARRRLDFVMEQVKDAGVAGIIWYELLCCETYDSESYYFQEKMREQNIPMLILESDYSTTNTGQLQTRVEGFMEILRGAAG